MDTPIPSILPPKRIAFIGLGEIGYHLAGHLATAGHLVKVHNRTSSKSERWLQQFRGTLATTPAEAAHETQYLFACVGDDDDLATLFLSSDSLLNALPREALIVDHTTASAGIARQIALRHPRFLDAPVSGGSAGAKAGKLSIMVGGTPEHYREVQPLLDLYAAKSTLLGPTGAGQLCKMVNQICIAGALQGLAEGLSLGKAAGLDLFQVLEVISAGAAASWQMNNRSSFMMQRSFKAGFAARWMHKDLAICQREAKQLNVPIPLSSLVAQMYSRLVADGHGDEDFSNLFRLVDVEPNDSQRPR